MRKACPSSCATTSSKVIGYELRLPVILSKFVGTCTYLATSSKFCRITPRLKSDTNPVMWIIFKFDWCFCHVKKVITITLFREVDQKHGICEQIVFCRDTFLNFQRPNTLPGATETCCFKLPILTCHVQMVVFIGCSQHRNNVVAQVAFIVFDFNLQSLIRNNQETKTTFNFSHFGSITGTSSSPESLCL